MKFAHVTISVRNLEESLQFYQNIVGLPVKRRFVAGESEITFLGDGETAIELIHNQKHTDLSFGQNISLGFEVASLQEILSHLKRQGIPTSEILQPDPQVRFIFTSDPDGVKIQFIESIK